MHPCLTAITLPLVALVSGSSGLPGLSELSEPAAQEPVTIRFEPTPGLEVGKLFTFKHELDIQEMGFTRDGGELMKEDSGGWVSTWMRIKCDDTFMEVGDGRPLVVRRAFRDLAAGGKVNLRRGDGSKVNEKSASGSPFQGRAVLFTWVPEEGEYARMHHRLDAEEEWLADLRGEMDLIEMLPAGPVAAGDSWPVDLESFKKVLAPGGNLLLTPRGGNYFGRLMEVGVGGDFADLLDYELFGDVLATFQGVREQDGARLAEIAVAVNVLSIADRTLLYATAMPAQEKKEATRLKSVTVDFNIQGGGTLLWNLDLGRFESFELEADENFRASVQKEASDGAGLFDFSQQSAFGGKLTIKYETTDPRKPKKVAPDEEQAGDEDGDSTEDGKGR